MTEETFLARHDKTDIVARLRGYLDKYDDAAPYDLLNEAADEIERLRDKVTYWKHRSDMEERGWR